jgi:secreted trypsin-like serine protease
MAMIQKLLVRKVALILALACGLAALWISAPLAAAQSLRLPFDSIIEKLVQKKPQTGRAQNSEIILGSAVGVAIYPFQVSLIAAEVAKGQEPEGHFCGGSLIGPTWVLTAAHCVTSGGQVVTPGVIDVYLGSIEFSGGDRIPVKAIIRHPDFVLEFFENDVALLQLSREPVPALRTSNRASEIEIVTLANEAEFTSPGTAATITGWGTTENSRFSRRLHAASVRIIDRKQCNGNILEKRARDLDDELSAIARSFRIDQPRLREVQDAIIRNAGPLVSDGMFCAGSPETPTAARVADACQGDSGGPIFVTKESGDYVQIGIISWGEGCGLPKLYGVYARLAKYAEWIARNAGEMAQLAKP